MRFSGRRISSLHRYLVRQSKVSRTGNIFYGRFARNTETMLPRYLVSRASCLPWTQELNACSSIFSKIIRPCRNGPLSPDLQWRTAKKLITRFGEIFGKSNRGGIISDANYSGQRTRPERARRALGLLKDSGRAAYLTNRLHSLRQNQRCDSPTFSRDPMLSRWEGYGVRRHRYPFAACEPRFLIIIYATPRYE